MTPIQSATAAIATYLLAELLLPLVQLAKRWAWFDARPTPVKQAVIALLAFGLVKGLQWGFGQVHLGFVFGQLGDLQALVSAALAYQFHDSRAPDPGGA